MAKPNFRALCAELIEWLILSETPPWEVIDQARDELATPPPEPPTDEEILEFLLERFQMHSPKMNGQHSWRFMNDYFMGKAVGRSAKDAVIACIKEQAKRNTDLESHEK